MLPDMSETLEEWVLPYPIKTVTRLTSDFEPADVVTSRTVAAVVQPADMEKINPDLIDWSRKYIQVHAAEPIAVGEFIEYEGEDYKFMGGRGYQLYGFDERIAEQTKKALLVVT
jgi:hypothetical protein